MKLKNKKGFTLVELIVVIAIIAILTAIIVPLVGRYSAQARYTTLNDAATTVSNSVNNGLSDANQIGVINVTQITGYKGNDGVLYVTVGTASGSSKPATSNSSKSNLDATTNEFKATDGDEATRRAASRIVGSLSEALPNNCAFYAAIRTSTVSGVIYTNAPATGASATDNKLGDTMEFEEVAGFDNAYQLKNGTAAYGLSGKYIPTSTGDDDSE